MLTIRSINESGSVTVDTTGLFRLVVNPGDITVDELVTREEADSFIDTFNAANVTSGRRASMIGYMALAQQALSCCAMAMSSAVCFSV
jgi:hypothetical protein